jgi:hypothetical protein
MMHIVDDVFSGPCSPGRNCFYIAPDRCCPCGSARYRWNTLARTVHDRSRDSRRGGRRRPSDQRSVWLRQIGAGGSDACPWGRACRGRQNRVVAPRSGCAVRRGARSDSRNDRSSRSGSGGCRYGGSYAPCRRSRHVDRRDGALPGRTDHGDSRLSTADCIPGGLPFVSFRTLCLAEDPGTEVVPHQTRRPADGPHLAEKAGGCDSLALADCAFQVSSSFRESGGPYWGTGQSGFRV